MIWCDNLGTGSLVYNPVYHSRTKLVEVDIQFICDRVATKEVRVCYVPTYEQTANCLTKALTFSRFSFLRNKLGVVELPSSLKGGVKTTAL